MNAKTKAQIAIKEKAEADKVFHANVLDKIDRLYSVAASVLNKSLDSQNKGWKTVDNSSGYIAEKEWLLYWSDKSRVITGMDEEYIYFKAGMFLDSKARDLKISLDILTLSDRDFAKSLRKSIKKYKDHLRWYRGYSANKTILENLQKIKELETENRMLKNDVERLKSFDGKVAK